MKKKDSLIQKIMNTKVQFHPEMMLYEVVSMNNFLLRDEDRIYSDIRFNYEKKA